MIQRVLRRLRGRPTLTVYEREVLEQEYGRLLRQRDGMEGRLGTVHCSSCLSAEDPRTQHILSHRRALDRTLDDIVWKLGYVPEVTRSRRAQR